MLNVMLKIEKQSITIISHSWSVIKAFTDLSIARETTKHVTMSYCSGNIII